MQQHSLTTGRNSFQFLPPVAYELAHVILCALEVPNLLPKRLEFFFGQPEHMMARRAIVVTCAQDLGKLFQGEPQLQGSLHKLDALDGGCGEHPIPALRPL